VAKISHLLRRRNSAAVGSRHCLKKKGLARKANPDLSHRFQPGAMSASATADCRRQRVSSISSWREESWIMFPRKAGWSPSRGFHSKVRRSVPK
jgi:hypothetical protein